MGVVDGCVGLGGGVGVVGCLVLWGWWGGGWSNFMDFMVKCYGQVWKTQYFFLVQVVVEWVVVGCIVVVGLVIKLVVVLMVGAGMGGVLVRGGMGSVK